MSHHAGKGLVKYFLNVSQNLGLLFYCDLLYVNMYLCIDIQDASNFKCELASKVLFLGRFELSFSVAITSLQLIKLIKPVYIKRAHTIYHFHLLVQLLFNSRLLFRHCPLLFLIILLRTGQFLLVIILQ